MKIGVAKYSWLVGDDIRLDSSFHLSDGRVYRKHLENFPLGTHKLSEVTSAIFNGARFKRYYVKNEEMGIPFMGSSDMLKSDLNDLKYISRKLSKNVHALTLKKDWILVSCSGTIGNAVYTNSDFESKTASQHILRIVPNGKVQPGYIYAFLSSKYGYALLTQGTYGAVIQHIEPHHIADLPVPGLPKSEQKEIHNLIYEASTLRAKANQRLRDVVTSVERKMNSRYREKGSFRASTRPIRDIYAENSRLDAPYNSSMGRFLYDRILEDSHKTLSDISVVFHPILFGKKQIKGTPYKGNPLYKSSSMIKQKPETDFWLSLKKVSAYKKLQVKEGWVLVSRTGTVGNVVRIGKTMNDSFIDDHMIRIRPTAGFEGLIYCYLKSHHGQKLIDFQKYGSVQEVINSNYIQRIPIPEFLFEPMFVRKINSEVKELSSFIDDAYDKELLAIELLEAKIESWQKS